MKLFLRGELERAARLALLNHVREPQGDPERAIRSAVEVVAQDGEEFLTRVQAEEAASLAAQLIHQYNLLPIDDEDVRKAAQSAVRAVLDERGHGQRG